LLALFDQGPMYEESTQGFAPPGDYQGHRNYAGKHSVLIRKWVQDTKHAPFIFLKHVTVYRRIGKMNIRPKAICCLGRCIPITFVYANSEKPR